MSELANSGVPKIIIEHLTGKAQAGTLDRYITFDPRTLLKAIKTLRFSTNFLPRKKGQIFDYEKPDLIL